VPGVAVIVPFVGAVQLSHNVLVVNLPPCHGSFTSRVAEKLFVTLDSVVSPFDGWVVIYKVPISRRAGSSVTRRFTRARTWA
jgi:hypothetical protein